MTWLQSIFQGDALGIKLTFIVLVLALALVLLFWIFRKIAGANQVKAPRTRKPRLSVTDAAVVDDKRRLVLVRRDDIEHLVMIGGPTDIVIEQGIPVIHREFVHEQTHVETQNGHTGDMDDPSLSEHEPIAAAAPHKPPLQDTPGMPAKPEPGHPVQASAEIPATGSQIAPERPLGERAMSRRLDLTPPPIAATGRPARHAVITEPGVTTRETGNDDDFDAQFTSDLEAVFNEEEAATPSVTAESRYGASQSGPAGGAKPSEPQVRGRGENMEEEMQRLLDELSGAKPH